MRKDIVNLFISRIEGKCYADHKWDYEEGKCTRKYCLYLHKKVLLLRINSANYNCRINALIVCFTLYVSLSTWIFWNKLYIWMPASILWIQMYIEMWLYPSRLSSHSWLHSKSRWWVLWPNLIKYIYVLSIYQTIYSYMILINFTMKFNP